MNATLPGSSLRDFSRILTCFSRIGDEISLEVRPGKLLLSTLNSSRSAFILVTLDGTRFERFEYLPRHNEGLRCRMQLRALLSIFRPRNIETKDGREGAVERCELKLLHPRGDSGTCQFLIRLVCRHGVRKTYTLHYETTQTMHALTDRTSMGNTFTLPGRAMKEVMDHFAPRAEEVTLTGDAGALLMTSFTEGVVSDKEVLKQPIHTSVTVDGKEFEVMDVDETQITFGLREFRAVGALCDSLSAAMQVSFGRAGKPLLVEWERDGLVGEFVVATTDDGERGARVLPRESASQYMPRHVSQPKSPPSSSPPAQEEASMGGQDYSHTLSPTRQQEEALFAPDPDEQDPSVQARHSRLREHEQQNNVAHQEMDDEDEMQLYADEADFGMEEELGPTQTQSINRHKGLFD